MANFRKRRQILSVSDLHELIILMVSLKHVELWHDIVVKNFIVGY